VRQHVFQAWDHHLNPARGLLLRGQQPLAQPAGGQLARKDRRAQRREHGVLLAARLEVHGAAHPAFIPRRARSLQPDLVQHRQRGRVRGERFRRAFVPGDEDGGVDGHAFVVAVRRSRQRRVGNPEPGANAEVVAKETALELRRHLLDQVRAAVASDVEVARDTG
jgi:hypothetical protein